MNMMQMQVKKLDNYGRGITYYNDTIMFVNGALPEEDITVKNIKENKKFYESDLDEILEESTSRVVPKCPFYELCGGCNLMHMADPLQQEFKLNKVRDILNKYTYYKGEIKLIESNQQLFYRNKITLKVLNNKWGYYNSKTHDLVEVTSCLIAKQEINEVITNHEYLNITNGEVVIRSNQDKEVLISIRSEEEVTINEELIPSNVAGIILNNKAIYKNDYFYDTIGDLKFKVTYNSFFQVNNFMAGRIFNILNGNLSGTNLLDLYCGVGTLGLSVANKFKNIYGIEIVENAITDAKHNAKINNISNTHYYAGSTDDILENLNVKFDTIILDPPRSGLNKKTIEQVLKIRPKVIAYVSCDPMTLARDLKILSDKYKITKVNALEMFPNTFHVESLVILEKK